MAASLLQGRIDAAMMTGSYFAQARNDVELLANADAAIAPLFLTFAESLSVAELQPAIDTGMTYGRLKTAQRAPPGNRRGQGRSASRETFHPTTIS